jgi:anti-sigma factor RsiW
MKSLDRQSLEEQTRLVSRYVAGDLSRSERAEFEAWLVASPALATEVEMERRLRRGIASAARRGWLNRSAPRSVVHERRWRMAIAASLLAAVTVGSVMLAPRADQPSMAESRVSTRHSPIVASRVVQLASVRGASGAPDLELSRADAPTELVLQPEVVVLTCEDGAIGFECPNGAAPATPQYPEYEVDVVDRARSALVWRSPRQTPVSGNQLSFALRDPATLEAGDYDLIVRGHAPDHEEVVGRFVLRVTR